MKTYRDNFHAKTIVVLSLITTAVLAIIVASNTINTVVYSSRLYLSETLLISVKEAVDNKS